MKKISLFFTIIVMMSGCSDNLLNTTNYDAASSEQFPNDAKTLELVAYNIYANLNDYNLYGQSDYIIGSLFTAAHTVDFGFKAETNWEEFAYHRLTSKNGSLGQTWEGLYRVIGSCNVLLKAIDNIDITVLPDADVKRIQDFRGDGLFWRGWAHEQLVQQFGEGYPANGDGEKQGIIIHTEVASNSTLQYLKRSTVNEVYAQIFADYTAAEAILPASWTGQDVARPTKHTVNAFIGQLLLFKGDKAAAAVALKNVIDNSGKKLLSFADYAKLFNEDQIKFSDESLLELSLRNRPGSWGVWSGSEGSMWALKIAPFIGELQLDGAAKPIVENGKYKLTKTQETGWCNLFFHDRNISRFGDDPRLRVVAMEGVSGYDPVNSLTDADPSKLIYGNKVLLPYVGTFGYNNDKGEPIKGWTIRKYNPLEKDLYSWGVNTGINMHFMRMADVYLMYAEALIGTNDPTACQYINKVRRRAYDKTDASVDISATGTELTNILFEERFKEFCAEGPQNWYDLCRFKKLDEVVKKWYTYILLQPVGPITTDSKSLYFPIPIKEIESNSLCKQNTGY